ncbi:MAG: hypothetical protein QOC68_467 [Solirubrobacteraceae bacterium]|nr:hypothetical protein [Solirubrobacteraceae bacterium]
MKAALALALLAVALLPAAAAAEFPGTGVQSLSAAPSRNPAISQDKRFARLAAFEADTGGTTNVFVVRRADGYGDNGTPWHAGAEVLASRGLGGQPANGPSTQPSLDGTSRVAPHCVAFVSAASNLVPGDTNGRPDAFLYDLRSGSVRRVSLNSRGRQSSGTVSEVAVNGLCTRVAFVSDAADLALRRTRNRSWRTAVTRANPPGRRQVYVRALGGTKGIDRALKGLTFLASATDGGRPGDGDSHSIAFTHNGTTRAITFASEAGNLSSRDGNGVTDVYQRVMTRRYGARVHGRSVQRLHMDTRLVSAGPDGRAGAAASHSPSSNVDGTVVAFVTTAADLVGRATRGISQVVKAHVGAGSPALRLASRTSRGAPGNGPSTAPTLTAGGTWVMFESDATDIAVTTARRPDVNGVRDAMLSTEPSGERWLLGERGATGPTTDPMSSPHGNYVVFERGGHAALLYVGPK